jgi:hypothetical protein
MADRQATGQGGRGGASVHQESFREPGEVLARDDLDYEAKLEILQGWRADLRRTDTDGARKNELDEVEQALLQLQADVAVDPDKPAAAPSGDEYRPRGDKA